MRPPKHHTDMRSHSPSSRLGFTSLPGLALQSYTSSASSRTTFMNSSKPWPRVSRHNSTHPYTSFNPFRRRTHDEVRLDPELVVVIQPNHDAGVLHAISTGGSPLGPNYRLRANGLCPAACPDGRRTFCNKENRMLIG